MAPLSFTLCVLHLALLLKSGAAQGKILDKDRIVFEDEFRIILNRKKESSGNEYQSNNEIFVNGQYVSGTKNKDTKKPEVESGIKLENGWLSQTKKKPFFHHNNERPASENLAGGKIAITENYPSLTPFDWLDTYLPHSLEGHYGPPPSIYFPPEWEKPFFGYDYRPNYFQSFGGLSGGRSLRKGRQAEDGLVFPGSTNGISSWRFPGRKPFGVVSPQRFPKYPASGSLLFPTNSPISGAQTFPNNSPQPPPRTTTPTPNANCVQSCLTTPEYNPVCGSDNVTYRNPGRLRCTVQCGKRGVQVLYFGNCVTQATAGGRDWNLG